MLILNIVLCCLPQTFCSKDKTFLIILEDESIKGEEKHEYYLLKVAQYKWLVGVKHHTMYSISHDTIKK